MTPCVPPDTLEQLLAGTLAEPEVRRAREHLAQCPACQQAMDRLTDLPQLARWRDECPTAPLPAAPVSLPSFLVRMRDTPLSEAPTAEDGAPVGGATYSYLRPPQRNGDLGMLGPYRVLAELGRGGMGVVFRAFDPALNREVALKVLWPERADARARARFVREARAAAALVHDHVAPVYSVTDPPDGPPYLTMQFVPGPSLGRHLRDRVRLPAHEAAHVALQVAEALACAHQAGLVHRDVKPANVLLDPTDGRAKLVDFGLVRVLEEPGQTTAEGVVRGTPEYMSPEQIRAPDRVDGRADVYGLGMTLYEALTGALPFRGTPARVLHQVLHEEPAPPRRLNDRVPRDLETVCLKALAKEPGQRYPSAGAFADDLRRFLRGEPVRARPVSAWERGWRWCRRNPWVAGLTAAVALLLLAVTGASVAVAVYLGDQNRHIVRAEEDSRAKAFDALVSQARAGRFSHRMGQRFDTLKAIREAQRLLLDLDMSEEQRARERDALRTLAISALILPDVHKVGLLPELAKDAAGDQFLESDPQGNVKLCRAGDHTELARLPGDGRACEVGFNPLDPKRVWVRRANADGWRILEWDPATNQLRELVGQTGGRDRVSLSLDLRTWAVANNAKGVIEIRELPSFRVVRRLTVRPDEIQFALSPDGRQIAVWLGGYFQLDRRVVRVYDVATGDPVAELKNGNRVFSAEWLPDGRTLIAGGWDTNELVFWDVLTQKAFRTLDRQKGGEPVLAGNRTGDLLASNANWFGSLYLFHPRTGQELLSVRAEGLHLRRPSRGDSLFAYRELADASLEKWEIVPGAEYRTLTRPQGKPLVETRSLTVSSDGRLAASCAGFGVMIWDLTSGEYCAFLPIGQSATWFEPASGDLFTNSPLGLFRWPIRKASAGALRIGPPQRWTARGQFGGAIHGSADGQVIAVSGFNYSAFSLLFHAGPPRRLLHLGPHTDVPQGDVRHVVVSPDGRLAVTCSFLKQGIKVWDTRTGRLLRRQATGDLNRAAFSPDGRRLAVGSRAGLWVIQVEPWQELLKLPPLPVVGDVAFSPDGRLLALEGGQGALRLVDSADGRELALLEDPNQSRATCFSFTPDGTRLVVASNDSQALHVWDLRALRRQLVELGLDWDAPPYPPAPPAPACGRPETLLAEVDLGHFVREVWDTDGLVRQSIKHQQKKEYAKCLAELRQAVRLGPGNAYAHHQLAWQLLIFPAPYRDAVEALGRARRAVELTPGEGLFLDTLGAALYRNGRIAEAVSTLQEGLKASGGKYDAYYLYFLAMCYQRQGDSPRAKDFYERAGRWVEANRQQLFQPWRGDINDLRAEAEELFLGKRP